MIREDYIVQKSYPFINALRKAKLSIDELKIIDVYLSQINSHNEDTAEIELLQKDFEHCIGVARIRPASMRQRLTKIAETVVEIGDPESTGMHRLRPAFAIVDSQKPNGMWKIIMKCNKDAMPYLFHIDKIGYVSYPVKNVLSLTQTASYHLYIYLLQNRFRRKWTIDINQFREVLNCPNSATYRDFKRFHDIMLKPAVREVIEKTGLLCSYRVIKNGIVADRIEFVVSEKPKVDLPAHIYAPKTGMSMESLVDFACRSTFTHEQNDEIVEILNASDTFKALDDSEESNIKRMHYVYDKFITMRFTTGVKQPFAYLKKMIKNDLKVE